MLRSVGYKAIEIGFVVNDDCESLSDEFVGDSDHGKLSGLSILSEPYVSFSDLFHTLMPCLFKFIMIKVNIQ